MKLEEFQAEIEPHLSEISALFVACGMAAPKMTLVCRTPEFEDGDVVMTIDDLPLAIAAIERRAGISRTAPTPASRASQDVLAERERQQAGEGFTAEHDDDHVRGEMALAAACYAVIGFPSEAAKIASVELWPWDQRWWKPSGFRRDMVRAGALILAEIERFDRVAARKAAR